MKNILQTPILACLLILISCQENPRPPQIDFAIENANIIFPDSICEGCFIETAAGKILSVKKGNYTGHAQKVLNVNKAFVYAGFIDAHAHFLGYGKSLRTVDLRGTTSWEQVVERTIEFAKEHPEMEFVTGRGWDQNDWSSKEFPSMEALNIAFPSTPVLLSRIDGHAAIANQAALDYAGIDGPMEIQGGSLVTLDNKLTGVLIDNAIELIQVPDLTNAQIIDALKKAERNCFAVGLTTIDDAGLSKPMIDLIDSLHREDVLKMRIYAMVSDDPRWMDYYLDAGPYKTDRLNVRSFKFYGDGALGSRGACLVQPYHDKPDETGFLLSSIEHFETSAKKMAEAGFQMNTHAIGDSANKVILNIYKQYNSPQEDLRWRIEHAQVLQEEDFKLFKEHHIIPSIQPTHATSDMYWAGERLGDERLENAYAYRRLLENRGLVALGTDFPVEQIDPLYTFYAAVVRKDHDGFPDGGFQMKDALSRVDALRGMTEWAAYANFEENEKGSVTPGKWADFTILDTDLLNCEEGAILNTQVLYTIVNGEVVYMNESTKK